MPEATVYSGEKGYEELCKRDDIDLVYIATDWLHHFPVAMCAMENGKHTAIEVPSAMSLKECWALIDMSEKTRKHCMILENCCYDWFEMNTLNMAQQGVFGEVIRAQGAYIHNLDEFWDYYWKKGNGLNISTNNITYCTVGMYKNALTTAGITDADIIVAGPKPISGTAALVGIFEAYEAMTGEAVQDNVVDAALNELVVTGELEASIQGLTDQEVEEFIAYIKSLIAEKGLTDEKSINEAIDEACDKYGVTLSDDERQKIVDLLLKITSLGIDLSGLVDYAASLYNSFKNGGSSSGIIASIGNFFGNIFSAIGEFFKNLFK